MRLHPAHILVALLPAMLHAAIAGQTVAVQTSQAAPPLLPTVPTLPTLPTAQAAQTAQTAQTTQTTQTTQTVEITGTADAGGMSDSAGTRMVVPRAELSKFGETRLADALQRIPGVQVETTSGRAVVRVRGLGEGYTQVLVNGEPARLDFSVDSIPVALVDRVEISRVGTVDMRSAGIAGTVNIVLRQAPRTPRRELKAHLSTQRAQPSQVIDGFVGDAHDKLAYSLGVVAARIVNEQPIVYDQSFTTGPGELQSLRHIDRFELNQTESVTLAPQFTWQPRDGETLRVESLARLQHYIGLATDDRVATLGTPPDFDHDRLDARNETAAASTRLAWARALGDGHKLEGKLSASRSRRQADSVLYGFDKSTDHAFVQELARRVHSQATDDSALLSGSYRISPSADQVPAGTFAIGWDAEHTQRDEDRIQREATGPDRTPQNLAENYTARIQRVALYLQDEWEFSSSASLYVGVRWEGMRTSSTGSAVQGATVTSCVFSPVIESRWKLSSSQDKLRLSLGRSYKAPTTMELMARRWVVADNSPTTPNFQGNGHLRPELAWGLDLSFEHPWATAGVSTATVFGKRIEDVILRDVSADDGVWVQQPVNRGQATVQGIEFDTRLNVGKLWPGAPPLDIRLNAMRAWSRVDAIPAPNSHLDRQRPFSVGIGLNYRLTSPELSIGSNLGIVGGGWSRTSATVSAYAPPERRAEAYAAWRMHPGALVRLAVNRKTRGHAAHRGLAEDIFVDDLGAFRQTTHEPLATTWRLGIEWML